MTTAPRIPLSDGSSIPAVGFGTARLWNDEGRQAIASALERGYRLIDTAWRYENEREVGEAIAGSGVPRQELVVTTKLPGRHHGYEETLASVEESRRRLGLDTIDLYLIHWPLPRLDRYVESWRALQRLRDDGLVRSIGVSNFEPEHLTRLIDETGEAPAVNQVELHPRFPQTGLRAFHAEHGVLTQSWSPLGRGTGITDEPVVRRIAEQHGVAPGQVVLRWHVELGVVPIPRSSDGERQRQNLDVFGFSLAPEEIAAITALERADGRLGGQDPTVYEEF